MMASFGENLRRERELRGIDLREIAEATKISVRFLQALEQDRLEILPGGLFPRAFVRQYAKHLGLTRAPVPIRLRAVGRPVHGESAEPTSPAATSSSALLVAWSRPARCWRSDTDPGRGLSGGRAGSAAGDPARRPRPSPSAGAVFDPLSLVLTRRAADMLGRRPGQCHDLDRVLIEGETETIEAHGEIVLSVGNAGGLSFSVNNRPGVALGRSGEVRRNIVITPGNLDSLVEAAPGRPSHSS
jgi:hypothetical protein